ncbi:hypothetical protein Pma05_69320 [Plantactinospora mayteni]|uniref:Uncharacterized protein n=1 Tax=Plantactinospora mayteni TaxID=566021 RepID=A0ABQ4F0D6_9ACTN|nr:hypothetical protein Pma05_69320 [Plantactinospora mayteni]
MSTHDEVRRPWDLKARVNRPLGSVAFVAPAARRPEWISTRVGRDDGPAVCGQPAVYEKCAARPPH